MAEIIEKCRYSEECGGCTYQGIAYEKQLIRKQKEVEELFKGICSVEPIVGMYRPYYYRNKVHAVVGKDRNGEIITGTYKEGTHVLVAVDKCSLQDELADQIIYTLKGLFKSFKYEPYDEDKRIGLIRHILIRRGFSTKQLMVVLVTADNQVPGKKNFINALLEKHPEITTIIQNVNSRSTSMILGDRENIWYGKGFIEDVLCGSRFRISSKSFYQINPQQTEKLYKAAIKMADLKGKETVIDAYCGIGTIGITASKKAKRVIGVELNKDAVSDAKANAGLNLIKNCSFYAGDAGDFLVDYAAREKADVIFMDPPRSGSTPEFLDSIAKIKPEKVVYISCNPETQVRDIGILQKHGYEAKECKVFDLFPWAGCVETAVLLVREP